MSAECLAKSPRMNCGCCGDVEFGCDRPAGHAGSHTDSSHYNGMLDVTWQETQARVDARAVTAWLREFTFAQYADKVRVSHQCGMFHTRPLTELGAAFEVAGTHLEQCPLRLNGLAR